MIKKLIKLLEFLIKKKCVIFTPEEFAEMMRPYEFTMKVAQNLGRLESELHMSDDADQIIKRALKEACEFYGADWAGFLDVDMVMKVWSPHHWYNTHSRDQTKELMEEFESLDCMKQWITAMHENQPICIPDVEALKETNPEEYAMYRKLRANSILAVPVFPRPLGFMVVRNPTRHISPEETLMLRMIAYVLLTNINDQTSNEKLKRTYSPQNITDPNDVIINMLGDLEVITSTGVLTEKMIASPAITKILVFLYLNKGKSFAARTLIDEIFPDRDERDIEKEVSALRTQICHSRQLFDTISAKELITSSHSGYCISESFDVKTDVQLFEEYVDRGMAATSSFDKIEWMKLAVDLYRGDLLTSAYGERWLDTDLHYYHMSYVTAVNILLENLAANDAYNHVRHSAEKSLKIESGNFQAYYWLIKAYSKLNASELTEGILKRAEAELPEEKHEKLLESLQNEGII